jgi:hypothetical protein
LSKTLACTGGNSGCMTVPDGKPYVNGNAESTEDSTLPLDDGDIYVCQDGPRDAPAPLLIHASASSTRSWNPAARLLAFTAIHTAQEGES